MKPTGDGFTRRGFVAGCAAVLAAQGCATVPRLPNVRAPAQPCAHRHCRYWRPNGYCGSRVFEQPVERP